MLLINRLTAIIFIRPFTLITLWVRNRRVRDLKDILPDGLRSLIKSIRSEGRRIGFRRSFPCGMRWSDRGSGKISGASENYSSPRISGASENYILRDITTTSL